MLTGLRCGIAIASLVFASTMASANGTAGHLLNACERLDRSAKIASDGVTFTQDFDTIYCWGFMSAIQQTSALVVDGKRLLMSCPPANSTITQLIKVFVAWGNRNPASLHNQASAMVQNALIEAFPCPKKN